MTGLGTNILVRFITEDDPDQSKRADNFLQSLSPENPGFIPLVTLAELVWVLRGRFRSSKLQIIQRLAQILNSPELVVEGRMAVYTALARFSTSKADFADCLIACLGDAADCHDTVTFDVDAARYAGMRLL